VRLLLVTSKIVPSSPIFVTLMIEEQRSFETSVLTRTTLRNVPEDSILRGLDAFKRWKVTDRKRQGYIKERSLSNKIVCELQSWSFDHFALRRK
jgi:hypothetical protein